MLYWGDGGGLADGAGEAACDCAAVVGSSGFWPHAVKRMASSRIVAEKAVFLFMLSLSVSFLVVGLLEDSS
ncbi:hypothetical protein [Paenibacillus sp. USDA918EY]|uniref:hypothetical protein n=1 Tax=Paenibacillus sp. USDA918EY TaxID=2689575 RepID=UPI001F22A8D5|nr:hypothetical protein [Paenibacillus sp. USDA918EY]